MQLPPPAAAGLNPAFPFQQTLPTILCCMCGTAIPSNPSNMCVNCIRTQVDITDGIPKQVTIHWCKFCNRYLNPPTSWIKAELESRELLSFCVKRLKGLNKVKLVDASFVWTEPHSRRLKVKLTIQKEVFTQTILQQVFIVEYVVHLQQCIQCVRLETEHAWNALVQLRQKVDHKRTFYLLEQLILKHQAAQQAINSKEVADGIDFFFGHRSHALKFIDFLQNVVPIKYRSAEQLISQDDVNNTYHFKYTFSVEIAPVCREDLLCLPTRFANAQGNISPICLVTKVSSIIHVIDPNTLQAGQIMGEIYWKYPFRSLSTQKQMIEFTVLDINPLAVHQGKFQLAEVQVARNTDLGMNDIQYFCRTHLGNVLHPGDTALGYFVASANFNDDDLKSFKFNKNAMPDVVLVRKVYPNKKKKGNRLWRLKQLRKDEDMRDHEEAKARRDYEEFLEDVARDPETRAQINLYKDRKAAQKIQAMLESRNQMTDVGDALPEGEGDEVDPNDVRLEELMEDLSIADSASNAGDDLEDDEAFVDPSEL